MEKIGKYNMQGLQKGQESQSDILSNSTRKIAGVTLGNFAGNSTSNNVKNATINIYSGNTEEVRKTIIELFTELNFQIEGV